MVYTGDSSVQYFASLNHTSDKRLDTNNMMIFHPHFTPLLTQSSVRDGELLEGASDNLFVGS